MVNGKKIVFVSVPMAGRNDAEIHRAIQMARREYMMKTKSDIREMAFIDNHMGYQQIQVPDDSNKSVVYLGVALKRMATADEVVFAKGWENARGCRIEHKVCEDYGIKIFECGVELAEM